MREQRILLVEGTDDEHVIKHLCTARGLPHLDVVKPAMGFENLLESLPVQIKASGPVQDIVGVVVDADEDSRRRWNSLRRCLERSGYANVAQEIPADGLVVSSVADMASLPRIGVWIMPDNRGSGMLEDFLRFLIPPDEWAQALADHVESSINSIPREAVRFSPLKRAKARIHTWLAWQEEPGKPLGQAITAKFLDPNVTQVELFIAWMRRLFQWPDAN